MLRYKTETRPGLVALYNIRPGNGAGPFLQPQSPHSIHKFNLKQKQNLVSCMQCTLLSARELWMDYTRKR